MKKQKVSLEKLLGGIRTQEGKVKSMEKYKEYVYGEEIHGHNLIEAAKWCQKLLGKLIENGYKGPLSITPTNKDVFYERYYYLKDGRLYCHCITSDQNEPYSRIKEIEISPDDVPFEWFRPGYLKFVGDTMGKILYEIDTQRRLREAERAIKDRDYSTAFNNLHLVEELVSSKVDRKTDRKAKKKAEKIRKKAFFQQMVDSYEKDKARKGY